AASVALSWPGPADEPAGLCRGGRHRGGRRSADIASGWLSLGGWIDNLSDERLHASAAQDISADPKRGQAPLPERPAGCYAQRCLTPFRMTPFRIGTKTRKTSAMKYNQVRINAIGYELAPVVVTTVELEARLQPLYQELRLPEGQLQSLTGILERRWWEPGYRLSDGAAAAAQKALAAVQVPAEAIDVV